MKAVLLSYFERKKVVKIPNDKEESDISYLEKAFKELFCYEGDLSTISLQKFNEEWQTDLDLDEGDVIIDKDVLKVVTFSKVSIY